ncbi:hypothetical protein PVAND_014801 [Polypedilum vanderplanki]|uniref:Uncharacterized protein n=1 Tax=Polypedilum vanderplanki TaxID=319348 RepID=A0A9J6BAT5_POLVA|nr:hypothetical protein PVAND_014801 [Polypedilum vanderplanki]
MKFYIVLICVIATFIVDVNCQLPITTPNTGTLPTAPGQNNMQCELFDLQISSLLDAVSRITLQQNLLGCLGVNTNNPQTTPNGLNPTLPGSSTTPTTPRLSSPGAGISTPPIGRVSTPQVGGITNPSASITTPQVGGVTTPRSDRAY